MGVLGVSIIMGLYYWFARLRFGYTFSGMLSQPLGAALVAGLATGKLSEAMVVGGGDSTCLSRSHLYTGRQCA